MSLFSENEKLPRRAIPLLGEGQRTPEMRADDLEAHNETRDLVAEMNALLGPMEMRAAGGLRAGDAQPATFILLAFPTEEMETAQVIQ